MAVTFQLIFVFITTFAISNAFYVQPDGSGFREQFLNKKINYLENKYDFIRRKIEAKQQDGISKSLIQHKDDVKDYLWNKKLAFVENKLKGTPVDFDAIKAKKEAEIKEALSTFDRGEGTDVRNYFLTKKLAFLQNEHKDTPIDLNAIKQKIEAKWNTKEIEQSEQEHKISKRDVLGTNIFDDLFNTLYGALNTALKSLVDDLLSSINDATNGLLGTGLDNIRNSFYSAIDNALPYSTTI